MFNYCSFKSGSVAAVIQQEASGNKYSSPVPGLLFFRRTVDIIFASSVRSLPSLYL